MFEATATMNIIGYGALIVIFFIWGYFFGRRSDGVNDECSDYDGDE